MVKRGGRSKLSDVPSYKGTNLIMGVSYFLSHLNLIALQRLDRLIPVQWGPRASSYEFGEHTNIHIKTTEN